MQLAALVAVGAFVGVVAGMMRTGGGILLPPALLHVLGGEVPGTPGLVPAVIGTALVANTLLSARAALHHARHGGLSRTVVLRWSLPVAVGGAAGGVVVAAAAPVTLLGLLSAALVTAGLALVGAGAAERRPPLRRPPGAVALSGFALGSVSAATGAGAGTFGGPLLRWLGEPNAAGHGAVFGTLLGLCALAALVPASQAVGAALPLGPAEAAGALAVAVAAGLTAPIGARFAEDGPTRLIPFALAFVLVATGFSLLRAALLG